MSAKRYAVNRPVSRIALPSDPITTQSNGRAVSARARRKRRAVLRMDPLPSKRRKTLHRTDEDAGKPAGRPALSFPSREMNTKSLRMEMRNNERNNRANTLQYGGERTATGNTVRNNFENIAAERQEMDLAFSIESDNARRSGMEYAAERIEIAAAEMARLTNALERAARRERA